MKCSRDRVGYVLEAKGSNCIKGKAIDDLLDYMGSTGLLEKYIFVERTDNPIKFAAKFTNNNSSIKRSTVLYVSRNYPYCEAGQAEDVHYGKRLPLFNIQIPEIILTCNTFKSGKEKYIVSMYCPDSRSGYRQCILPYVQEYFPSQVNEANYRKFYSTIQKCSLIIALQKKYNLGFAELIKEKHSLLSFLRTLEGKSLLSVQFKLIDRPIENALKMVVTRKYMVQMHQNNYYIVRRGLS